MEWRSEWEKEKVEKGKKGNKESTFNGRARRGKKEKREWGEKEKRGHTTTRDKEGETACFQPKIPEESLAFCQDNFKERVPK
jgi:hypothetical protein